MQGTLYLKISLSCRLHRRYSISKRNKEEIQIDAFSKSIKFEHATAKMYERFQKSYLFTKEEK